MKRKALLITDLYPLNREGYKFEKKTIAIHELFNLMEDIDVLVIRPLYISYKPYPKKKFPGSLTEGFHKFENVKIYTTIISVVPFIWFYHLKNELLNVIDKFCPDIVIGHKGVNAIIAYDIAKKTNTKFIYGIHGSDVQLFQKKFVGKKNREIFNEADFIAFRSIPLSYKIPIALKKNYFICNSGIDEKVIMKYNEIKSRYNSFNTIQITTIGSLDKLKNIDIVLKALKKIDDTTKYDYNIIGDGPECHNLKEITSELNFKNKIKFFGRISRKEVFSLLKKTHIFILVSAPETFGLSYLEAMALGCIVVGSKGWGIDGIINSGVNGFLCTPGSVSDIEEMLKKIIDLMYFKKIDSILKNQLVTINNYTSANTAANYEKFIINSMEK